MGWGWGVPLFSCAFGEKLCFDSPAQGRICPRRVEPLPRPWPPSRGFSSAPPPLPCLRDGWGVLDSTPFGLSGASPGFRDPWAEAAGAGAVGVGGLSPSTAGGGGAEGGVALRVEKAGAEALVGLNGSSGSRSVSGQGSRSVPGRAGGGAEGVSGEALLSSSIPRRHRHRRVAAAAAECRCSAALPRPAPPAAWEPERRARGGEEGRGRESRGKGAAKGKGAGGGRSGERGRRGRERGERGRAGESESKEREPGRGEGGSEERKTHARRDTRSLEFH